MTESRATAAGEASAAPVAIAASSEAATAPRTRPLRRRPGRVVPSATYRLQLRRGVRLQGGRRCLPPTWHGSGSATCTRRPICKRRPAASMATTWWTRDASTRSWAAAPAIGGSRAPWGAWDSARCSTSCPTTWPSRARRTPGGGTCWRTASRAATHATSTWSGTHPRRATATWSCCPSLATTTAASSRPASLARSDMAPPSACAITSTSAALAPLAVPAARAGRHADPLARAGLPGRRLPGTAALDRHGPREPAPAPPRQGGAAGVAGAAAR